MMYTRYSGIGEIPQQINQEKKKKKKYDVNIPVKAENLYYPVNNERKLQACIRFNESVR